MVTPAYRFTSRIVSLLLVVALTTITARAKEITVSSAATDQPLPNATVTCAAHDFLVDTDSNGRADISPISDTDSITVSHVGYHSVTLTFAQLAADGFVVRLEEAPAVVESVVVTASRWEESRRTVPFDMSVMSKDDRDLYQPQTAADMIAMTGEVQVQKSQLGGGSPMMRGFAANRVLIIVDGIRMNTAIFRSGNLQNVISIDPMSTQSAEVLLGPTSTVYGSDALGGVMNFRTAQPRFATEQSLLVSGSSTARVSSAASEKSYHLDLNIGGGKVASYTSVSYDDFGDVTMGSVGPGEYLRPMYQARVDGRDTALVNSDPAKQEGSGFTQTHFAQKFAFKPSPSWDLTTAVHYSATSDIPRYDRLIRTRNGQFRSAEWYYGPQKWLMASVVAEHQRASSWYDRARLATAYQYQEESRHDRDFGDVTLNHRVEKVNLFTVNLDFTRSVSPSHMLLYGAEALFNQIGSSANAVNITTSERSPLSTRYPDGSTWNSYALYAGSRASLGSMWSLHLGLRYNLVTVNAEFDTTFFPFPFTEADLTTGALTGSAGVVFMPDDNWTIKGNLSTGFRAPNIDDIGKIFDSEPGSVVVPNPDLRSEYVYSAELGLIRQFGQRTSFGVSVFYSYLDDAMVRRDFTFNGQDSIMYDGALSQVQAIQNASHVTIYGLHVSLNVTIIPDLTIVSIATIQDGEEELDDGATAPVRHVGPWFGSTRVKFARGRLTTTLSLDYNGEVSYANLPPSEIGKPYLYALDPNGNPYAPSWTDLSLGVVYELTSLLTVRAGIDNILDQRYRTYSSGIAAPGRNFTASLGIQW